jgi:hypothetical protein
LILKFFFSVSLSISIQTKKRYKRISHL